MSTDEEFTFQHIQTYSLAGTPSDIGSCTWRSVQRTIERLSQELDDATVKTLALDLGKIESCNSQFLGMLVHLHVRAKKRNKVFCVYQPQPFVYNVIKTMGLNEVFTVYQTRQEAFSAWNIAFFG